MDNNLFFGPVSKFIEQYRHIAAKYLVPQNSWVLYFPSNYQNVSAQLAELFDGHAIEHLIVIVGDNAQVMLCDVAASKHLQKIDLYLGTAAVCDYNALFVGGDNNELQLTVYLRGKYAHAQLHGIYLLDSVQKFTLKTAQHHDAPDTTSNLVMRGAVGGNAVAAYAGNIVVSGQAQRSNAAQHNKNLLLSGTARATSVPSLEVLNNEVSCAHGSATGPVDENALWYLQSRGIAADRAKFLLTQAFFVEVIQRWPVTMQDEFTKKLERFL